MHDSDRTLDEFDEWKIIQNTYDHLDAIELEMLLNKLSYVLILVNREDHPMGVGIFEYGFVICRIGSDRFPEEEGPEGCEEKWHFVRLPSSSFTFPTDPDRWWNSYPTMEDNDDDLSASDDDGDDSEVEIVSLKTACDIIVSYGQIELVHGETSVIYRSQNVRDDDLDHAMCK